MSKSVLVSGEFTIEGGDIAPDVDKTFLQEIADVLHVDSSEIKEFSVSKNSFFVSAIHWSSHIDEEEVRNFFKENAAEFAYYDIVVYNLDEPDFAVSSDD